ncbi:oxygen-insensitive NADPH nitroreductase [Paenibacillus athensensis]|uniref:Nitroreductase A n=1 Tax=Paenibacillus athensensis TaxID=1967502 RepID=A0A4Y8PYM5_9BACL|nr:oxygen-insensitive NADPH nitroreductase [Paenibacillus athensensis]MCD1258873.1 oxygen-insensitive NADPH nitroreductase [Paenibacillus athensensis]
MNDTIALLLQHRSIRKFTADPLAPEQVGHIIAAAQHASTSSNMQAYSVIGVTDEAVKRQLAALAGNQGYIVECPLFLVWCADLYRYAQAAGRHTDTPVTGNAENLIVATVDTALAAQNAAIAAESMGLGIVYIGGIRNQPDEVSALLKLPELVYPVFGMCVGVPDQEPLSRPRLPEQAVYHSQAYNTEGQAEAIDAYDQTIAQYMRERTRGKIATSWSKEMAAKAARPREHMRAFLQKMGFGLE